MHLNSSLHHEISRSKEIYILTNGVRTLQVNSELFKPHHIKLVSQEGGDIDAYIERLLYSLKIMHESDEAFYQKAKLTLLAITGQILNPIKLM